MSNQGITWSATRALIKADLRRRLILEGKAVSWASALLLLFKPGVVCAVAFRIVTLLHARRHRVLVRMIDDLQHLYTGIELHVGAEIGPGFVLGDRPGGGISEHVTMGRNCTVLGNATMTLNAHGIDLSKGRIVLGDHCVVGVGVRIIGAVKIADGTQIKPNAVVLVSSQVPGAVLDGIPARQRSVVPVDAVMRWNPLRALPLQLEPVHPTTGQPVTA